jgi:hypothetical protein
MVRKGIKLLCLADKMLDVVKDVPASEKLSVFTAAHYELFRQLDIRTAEGIGLLLDTHRKTILKSAEANRR